MKKGNVWFWISPIIITLLGMTFLRLVSDTPTGYEFWKRPVAKNVIELVSVLFLTFLVQTIVWFFFRRNSKNKEPSVKALLLECLYTLLISLFFINIGLVFIHRMTGDSIKLDHFVIASVIFSPLVVISYFLYSGRQLFEAYRMASVRKNEPIQETSDHLYVRANQKFEKVMFNDILFVEGLENYVAINTKNGKIITHSTLKNLLKELPEDLFVQSHKSFIINLKKISAVEGSTVFIGDLKIPVSRTYKEKAMPLILKNKLQQDS